MRPSRREVILLSLMQTLLFSRFRTCKTFHRTLLSDISALLTYF